MEDRRFALSDGDEIKRLLRAKSWAQSDLSDETAKLEGGRVSIDTIKRAESGGRRRLSNLNKIATALGVPVSQIIRRADARHADADSLGTGGRLHPRIKKFLSRNRLPRRTAIDEFIQLETSPGWRGWREDQVSKFPNVHDYEPPEDFQRLMIEFPPEADKPINKLYSFHSYSASEDSEDAMRIGEEPGLTLQALGGTWAHAVASSGIWNAINQEPIDPDPNCLRFRNRIEDHILRIRSGTSEVYANMNAEVLVVTSDRKIVITRRPGRKNQVSYGRWTASIEEQVLREKDDKSKETDKGDIFRTAHRGVTGELGVTVIEDRTRLLSFGCEFANFTAAFLFVVYCVEDFDGVLNKWADADDKKEAVAVDCLDEDEIPFALALDRWTPTPRAMVGSWVTDPNALSADLWHPIAKARLKAYQYHRRAIKKRSSHD